ncbi:MAG: peptide deformylase [Planctomycetes bacterium]|nr:peptide deformylase [Planctomycetota bacterium]
MAVKSILLLGNPVLYEISQPVRQDELEVVADLHDTLMAFREQYGVGRAIAAPQIGVLKRLVHMYVNGQATEFINPVLEDKSAGMIEIWDDCLSFPELLVKVQRHKSCRIRYRNLEWQQEEMHLEDDLSELLQHECDHLDGVLAVSRAIDGRSFALRSERKHLRGTQFTA